MLKYSVSFFKKHEGSVHSSAKHIVPLIVSTFAPKSVLDVGCGEGVWLREFKNSGVDRIKGIDGKWVEKSRLQIPSECFEECNLVTFPVIERKFDVAVCLEVAEHLPPSCAEDLVKHLTDAADVVVFSAAIPCQGGTGHVNERWQSYWKSLFSNRGYGCFDVFRAELWDQPNVSWWYKQNILVYVRNDCQASFSLDKFQAVPINIVHPDCFNDRAISPPLRSIAGNFPSAFWRAVKARLPFKTK